MHENECEKLKAELDEFEQELAEGTDGAGSEASIPEEDVMAE